VSPNFQIAFRFLVAKRRAMLLSLACIVLGVGFFVVTQATTSGFQDLFIKTLLGSDGAIRIQDEIQDTLRSMYATGNDPTSSFQIEEKEGVKYVEGIPQPKQIMRQLSYFPNVAGMAEVLHEDVIVTSSFKADTAQIYGINIDNPTDAAAIPDNFFKVSSLGTQIVQGSVEDFRNETDGVLIGTVLATRLQVAPGDSIIIKPSSNEENRRYRVAAVYETGVDEIDKVRVYLHLSEARSLLHKTTDASYIQIKLNDPYQAVADAAQMQAALRYSAAPWQQREAVWLSVFKALRVSSAITVSIFTLIAGIAMGSTLFMIVMEKTKEIAILRSMGYTPRDISSIFIWQAAIVLVVGCITGWAIGAGVTFGLSRVPLPIRGIFKTDTFVVTWSIWHYVEATVTAVVVVMVASLVPARRAARLQPGDVIRGTAQ
jgi:lipoprotein-releasing system permease protein